MTPYVSGLTFFSLCILNLFSFLCGDPSTAIDLNPTNSVAVNRFWDDDDPHIIPMVWTSTVLPGPPAAAIRRSQQHHPQVRTNRYKNKEVKQTKQNKAEQKNAVHAQ